MTSMPHLKTTLQKPNDSDAPENSVPVFSGDAFFRLEKLPECFILDQSATECAVYDRLKELTGASAIFRLSVFETAQGQTVFLAPSGPDEPENIDDFIFCAGISAKIVKSFGHPVDIGILSGGRMGDIGRCEKTDETIARGMELEKKLQACGFAATHHSILIEDAVKVSNLLLAPDSLSAEMILRAVAGVGSGKELGNILLFKGNKNENCSCPLISAMLTEKADKTDACRFLSSLRDISG